MTKQSWVYNVQKFMLTQDRTHVQKSFDSNTVYNFPDRKTIQMFINNRIDLKIVVYSDSEILHTHT